MDKKDRLYSCNICNKNYASYKSLWNHNNKFHKKMQTVNNICKDLCKDSCKENVKNCKENVKNCKENVKNLTCEFCNKYFSCRQSKYEHKKHFCKYKNINNNQNIDNNNQNNTINNNQNNTINNNQKQINIINNQKQIIINQIGKEAINCLPIKDILKIIGDGYNMPITCIKKLNFNKDIPENHSFCTTTLEGKHFTRINHETQKLEKINKVDFINEVLDSSLRFITNISLMTEFDDEYKNNIPVEYQNKIKDILDNQHKFNEAKNKKAFFNCINDLSYNFKDIILETWKLIQPINSIENIDGPLLIDENLNYILSDNEDNNIVL